MTASLVRIAFQRGEGFGSAGHPVHRSRIAKAFVAAHSTDFRLLQLLGYCPELNPDELLNQDVKTNALGKRRPISR